MRKNHLFLLTAALLLALSPNAWAVPAAPAPAVPASASSSPAASPAVPTVDPDLASIFGAQGRTQLCDPVYFVNCSRQCTCGTTITINAQGSGCDCGSAKSNCASQLVCPPGYTGSSISYSLCMT
jgi:hypothetical protein